MYRSQVRDVDKLKSRLIEEWEHFHQVVIDKAVRQWRPRLGACVRAHGGHFEHKALGVLTSCGFLPFAPTHTYIHTFIRTKGPLWSLTMLCELTVNHACAYWTLMPLSDLTKLAVAVADVDQFY